MSTMHEPIYVPSTLNAPPKATVKMPFVSSFGGSMGLELALSLGGVDLGGSVIERDEPK